MTVLSDISYFISDWDETITESDSMHLVGEAAYSHKPAFQPAWDFFAEAYHADYKEHKQQFESKHGHLEGLEKEVAFQERMAAIEQQSVDRVEGSDLFKGVPLESIRRQSQQITVRNGWWELVAQLRERNVPIAIISVNWSGEMIREAFRAQGYKTEGEDSDVTVYANEIIVDDNAIATGKLSRSKQEDMKQNDLRTGCDKRELVRHLRETSGKKRICYCGDSATDMLALLEADLGIVVAKKTLVEKLETCGVGVVPVEEAMGASERQLLYIEDWTSLLM